jgi:hypothetical protein
VKCNKKFQIRGENVEVEKFTFIGSEITRLKFTTVTVYKTLLCIVFS